MFSALLIPTSPPVANPAFVMLTLKAVGELKANLPDESRLAEIPTVPRSWLSSASWLAAVSPACPVIPNAAEPDAVFTVKVSVVPTAMVPLAAVPMVTGEVPATLVPVRPRAAASTSPLARLMSTAEPDWAVFPPPM